MNWSFVGPEPDTETTSEVMPERLVWLLSGDKLYTSCVWVDLLWPDGTCEIDRKVLRWFPLESSP